MRPRAAAAVCAAILLLFATLAGSAAARKSPTVDEPMHALAGWLWRHADDYRVDIEDPPLWGYWMSLANRRDALRVDTSDPEWAAIARTHWTQNGWWRRTLYGTPGNDADALVRRARRMALPIGVALGALVAGYAWRLGGPTAAVVAACLFALDPNFLGHAALVKNDVAVSLVFLAICYALWRVGTRITWTNAAVLGVLCGVAMSVKFSGLLALPIVGAVLLVRALVPAAWPLPRKRTLHTRPQRLLSAAAICVATGLLAVAVVWASYGFRYSATPDGETPLNIRLQRALAIKARMQATDPSLRPTPEQMAATPPGAFVTAVVALNDARLMPEAWLNGLLYTYHTSLIRPSYLLGEIRLTGTGYYFPLAMLFKTPVATMLLMAVALAVALRTTTRRPRGEGDSPKNFATRWALICLLLPAAIYLLVALRTNLNLGLRHVFPVYPPLYVAAGWALAHAWTHRAKLVRPAVIVLLLVLAAETLLAWPNYIAFFHVPAGGPRGGIRLLGDSNLDWGQDLPLLAKWQREHPDRPIYLRYFGTTDPARYLSAQPFDPGNPAWPGPPAVIAVSATYLQGLYVPQHLWPVYESLRRQEPIAVLGGSIYLFDPPPSSSSSAASARDASMTATAPSGTSTSP